jgi:lipopolysaccharide/colanic/teichoic acid biosynthesis glycosyltransferase
MVSTTAAVYERLLARKRTRRVGWSRRTFKRAFDALLAGFGLVGASPLCLLIALCIKLEDGGPIFYCQLRVGRGGEPFRVVKFRSMVRDAERLTGAVWASADDPRITRVGRLLRATALDELPQLWNIFKGDMSFVGPRPERPEFVERFRSEIHEYTRRFVVRPGLTGIAQIFAQYDSPPRRKLRYDLLYLRRQGFWLDFKLILLSFFITLRAKWEHRGTKFPRVSRARLG